MAEEKQAVLLLADGTIFYGKSAGKIGTTYGEICFNTGMTGYQEVFTDPSYFGQILVTTNVHIGNYGVNKLDTESKSIKIAGFVCRNFNVQYSRTRADGNIQSYFESEGLTAISGVDTRQLVKHIRDMGSMNALISSEDKSIDELKEILASVPNMEGLELASKVSTTEPYFYGNPDAEFKIAVLDLGVKENILRNFVERGCYIKVFPAKTTYLEMAEWRPDGYFLSNGPGDPASMDYAIKTVKDILNHDEKIFGICLGHQLLGLGLGINTFKMHHGHRGINHPVFNRITGKCEVTSQNHGFCLNPSEVLAMDELLEVTHINLNDQTIEGIRLRNGNGFSVQYHPEAAPGPHDASYLFDVFMNMVKSSVPA